MGKMDLTEKALVRGLSKNSVDANKRFIFNTFRLEGI